LVFKDKNNEEEYRTFKIINSSVGQVGAISALLTSLYVAYWIMTFLQDTSPFKIVAFVASVIPIIAMWILFACRLIVPIDLQLTKYRYHFLLLETIIVVGVSIGGGLVLLSRVLYGQCPSLILSKIWHCNPVAPVKGLPGDITISVIALPLLFKIILPFISFYMVILAFIIGVSFGVAAVVISESFTAFSLVIVLSLLIGGACYCHRIQHIYVFLYAMRYDETLRLRAQDFNERTERLRTEMGNILSCVCHDTKTVSLV